LIGVFGKPLFYFDFVYIELLGSRAV
jgi:hypothetical protein